MRPLFLLCILLLIGCQANDRQASSSPQNDTVWLQLGGQKIEVELAKTVAEQRKGLMNRDYLGPNQGMLFIFSTPEKQSFWMYNTKIPLDIGYFSKDGTLLEIYPMYPHDQTPVPSRSNKVQYALEMNQGWFAKHKIRPGTQLDLAAINNIH